MKLGINSILVICIMNIFLRILGIKKKARTCEGFKNSQSSALEQQRNI